MLLTKQEEEVLLVLVKRALEAPYGSEEQVECETLFYELCVIHGLKMEDAECYCLKATNMECMVHCLDLLHIACDMDSIMYWDLCGSEATLDMEKHHGLS